MVVLIIMEEMVRGCFDGAWSLSYCVIEVLSAERVKGTVVGFYISSSHFLLTWKVGEKVSQMVMGDALEGIAQL